MPAQSTSAVTWTREHVRELNERTLEHWPRYELVDGELIVTPAPVPRHQVAHSRLFLALANYVDRQDLGIVLSSPADIALDPLRKSYLQPDLFVVPHGGVWPPRTWRDVAALRLVVEILSPGTKRYDRGIKRRYYLRHGVPEVWLVDLDRRCVERWRPDDEAPEIVRDAISWVPRAELPRLRIDLRLLFAEVLGDA